jgi:methionyl-tRNA formyltransferase
MSGRLKTVFFGTGDIALPAWRRVLAGPDTEVVALVTQPDRPAGRHHRLRAPAIKLEAQAAGVEVMQPERARDAIPRLVETGADLFVVMAYGQILPRALLALPRLACWNLHASLLPRHRGASPIQAAVLAGDRESGVTVMHVAPELDAGDIVLARALELAADETGGSLHERLAELAPHALAAALSLLACGRAPRVPQDPGRATYLGKLERHDGEIDWTRPAAELERRIRAFDPWPSSWTLLPDGRVLKIFPPVAVDAGAGLAPGEVRAGDAGLAAGCGDGKALVLGGVQAENGRRMSAAAFVRGHPMPQGARFQASAG